MAKNRRQKVSQSDYHLHLVKKHVLEGVFVVLSCFSALILLALVTYSLPNMQHTAMSWQNSAGQFGIKAAHFLFAFLGHVAYLVPFGIELIALHMLWDYRKVLDYHWALLVVRFCGFILFITGACGLCDILLKQNDLWYTPGGIVGLGLLKLFWQGFEGPGTLIILLGFWSLGLTWIIGFSWIKLIEYLGMSTLFFGKYLGDALVFVKEKYLGMRQRTWLELKPKMKEPVEEKKKTLPVKSKVMPTLIQKPLLSDEPESVPEESSPYVVKVAIKEGLPDLSLLEKGLKLKSNQAYTAQELEHLSREVEQHLMDFAIQAQVVAVHPGPVITRFELQLGAGTKVSKLSSLSKDLARSLSVNRVRVVEVIPGKTVVGLELPNPERLTVRFGDVLNSEAYLQAHSPLSLALGVDIAGHQMVVDLAKMPHLLVAGTTGSGKSVGINSMILSLLFKSTPEQVRLILVDPKMLELSVYDGIPHLLTPVVTDMREAASALRWCVSEMERRYRLMSGFGVRNIVGFNDKVKEAIERGEPLIDPTIDPLVADAPTHLEPLPYIVVVIDELADMMMVVGKKVEQLIARIAQKARAAGIHLILATQRPSVDVLTGLIKSNIPTRISFQVSSKIDSRTILDQQGAEQLLGYGDMLFLAPGTGAPLRVHGAFVDDNEVHRVAEDWRKRGAPNYIEAITQMSVELGEGGMDEQDQAEESDPLYDQVVEFVIHHRKASISSVQRRFKIGYNRAARLVEDMEKSGILGPLEGGVREVLVPDSSNS
ncbi:MAG TPA: cell division protein FtsK [Legionellales bacterium]|nr:cell division protein FtsK [Legionellales bacterium]